jgi:WD40 repeat protein
LCPISSLFCVQTPFQKNSNYFFFRIASIMCYVSANMLSKRQGAELPAIQAKRHHGASIQRLSIATQWLRAGPVHIQGVLDIVSAFSQEFEGICSFTLEGHSRPISALAVLPDGKLASSSWDKTVRVWDVASGACLLTLAGHTSYVLALAVLPDGKLASGSSSHDNNIRVWC